MQLDHLLARLNSSVTHLAAGDAPALPGAARPADGHSPAREWPAHRLQPLLPHRGVVPLGAAAAGLAQDSAWWL
jgi:hypothetical protein